MKLLQVVIQRSPNVETLKLCFYSPGIPVLGDSTIVQFGQMFSKFEFLSSLTLSWNAFGIERDYTSFFEVLGESCSKLTDLQLGVELPFGVRQLLALMFERRRRIRRRALLHQEFIDQIAIDPAAVHLQFFPENLFPICSSLQRFTSCNSTISRLFSPGIIALFLRHFPQLQELEFDGCYSFFLQRIGITVRTAAT